MRKPKIACLIYSSLAAIPARSVEEASMVLDAREKNARLGITGYLMRGDSHFVQYIEGPTFAVDHLFAIIGSDRRHRAVVQEDRFEREERLFGAWTMGFAMPRELLRGCSSSWCDEAILNRLAAPDDPPPWNTGAFGHVDMHASLRRVS